MSGNSNSGRQPPLKVTANARRRVRVLVAGGISERAIAHRLGIASGTLRKYFLEDLTLGRDVARAENLDRLDAAAEAGNVSAMKHLDALYSATPAVAGGVPALAMGGKKQAAAKAAQTAGTGTEWGDDLDPGTAVGRVVN